MEPRASMAGMIFGAFTAHVCRGLPRVRAVATALLLGSMCSLAPAIVHAAPDAAKVRKAAEEFDEAVRLYKQKEFAEAASHFEAADAAVPSPKALRLAIKSRLEGNQVARAATLSAYAIENYPSDQETTATAKETIEKLKSSLQEVKVSCATLCILSVSGAAGGGVRSVHGNPNTRWTVYVESGKATISASFMGDLPGGEKAIEAVGGTSVDIRFEPSGGTAPVVPPPPPGEEPKKQPTTEPPPPDDTDDGGISPFFFLGGAVLTAAAGGVTIWSGIDATNNPGTDAVRAGCVGQGTECQLYQDGLAAEMRTNIFIGVTAGLGATTLVLAILTDWDGSPSSSTGVGAPAASVGGVKVAVPNIAASPEQGAVTFHGSF